MMVLHRLEVALLLLLAGRALSATEFDYFWRAALTMKDCAYLHSVPLDELVGVRVHPQVIAQLQASKLQAGRPN
jgi:hypothetical protein